MRVLFVTFIRPSSKFGGGISTFQSLKALSNCAELDYMGIDYSPSEFDAYGINITNRYIVKPEKSKLKVFVNLMLTGVSSSYYKNWLECVKNEIDISSYDCIYLDYTRHSFVAEWAQKNNKPLIVRSHNVEVDYFKSLYEKQKNIKNYMHIKTGKKNEKKCLDLAERILVLTKNEKNRYTELYGIPNEKFTIFPQCVKYFDDEPYKTDIPYILITGSLWFGPNADGVLWFLNEVWGQISKKVGSRYKLVIAGSKPNDLLIDKVKEFKDVELIPNPEEIGTFYRGACLYIAPIFYGAGMKVKVAEALSCGLKVIATSHALAGYESVDIFTVKADTKEEYIDAIMSEVNSGMGKEKDLILQAFEQHFSLDASSNIMHQVLKETMGES